MSKFSAIVMLGAMVLGAVLPGAWAESATITLKEEVYVKGPTVRLGDVADLQGVRALGLEDLEISTAARPGDSKNVHASLVASRLRGEGLDLDHFEIEGPARVKTTTMFAELGRGELAESLREFIELEMPWDPADTEIVVSDAISDLVAPAGEVSVEWRPNPQYRYLGDGIFQGTIFVDGERFRTVRMRAMVETYREVPVAITDIPRGRPISPRDVELRKLPMSARVTGGYLDMNQMQGLLARKTIFPGQALTTNNTAAPTLVDRNQVVSVEMSVAGMAITTQAKALHDAKAGDVLLCRNLASEETFQGVVQPDGTVRVR